MFDGMVRRCFGDFSGIHPTDLQWDQATRGLRFGGLGLRSTSSHAAAAYIASVGSSLEACAAIDATFSVTAAKAAPPLHQAVAAFNTSIPATEALSVETALALKQRDLSRHLDIASWNSQLARSSLVEQATLRSEAEIGARAFLVAIPSGACHMEGPAFLTELRARLAIPDASIDKWCPRCDAVLDAMSHHAAMCAAGEERTQRHHAVRDAVFKWAERAGLRPEKEPSRILLPQCPDDTAVSRRRPADVYIPAMAGGPVALDFAVTAPQRQETLTLAAHTAGAAAAAYAVHKEQHLQTGAECHRQGITFMPMVVESTGTWDAAAAKVLKHMAHAAAARSGSAPGEFFSALLQELCVVVRSWRARAVLRRRSEDAA